MINNYQQLITWLQTPLGKELINIEQETLCSMFTELSGNFALLMGGNFFVDSFPNIKKKIVVLPCGDRLQTSPHNSEQPMTSSEQLNSVAAHDSVDLIVMPHVLEFDDDPCALLREAARILRPEGHLIIIGFNPASLVGIQRWFKTRDNVPWKGNFYHRDKVKDWLQALNFEVNKQSQTFYRPLITNQKILQRFKFLELIGKFCYPFFGSIYIIDAQKKVLGLTPLKQYWGLVKDLLHSKEAISPVARTEIYHE